MSQPVSITAKHKKSRSGAGDPCPHCGKLLRGQKGLKMHIQQEHSQETGLCEYELTVLNAFAGSTVDDLVQGAALNAAAEALVASGYMNRGGDITEKGAIALGHSHPMRKKKGAR